MATSQNIKALIKKLATMEKNLGYKRLGEGQEDDKPKKGDSEFDQIRYMVLEKLDWVNKKQMEVD